MNLFCSSVSASVDFFHSFGKSSRALVSPLHWNTGRE